MEEFSQRDIGIYTRRWVASLPKIFLHPVNLARAYERKNFRADFIASLTVAIVLLPQAIAYALIAELPPQTGLFAAIVAGLIGGLWGSSHHLHTGPTNTTSLIVLSGLLTVAVPGTPEYLLAAGVVAVWAGLMRVLMGVARLGILVNFVSDAVVIGFTAGAGILIVVNQLRHLLRISGASSPYFYTTITNVIQNLGETHMITFYIGGGSVVLLLLMKRFTPKLPAPLLILLGASIIVWLFGLDQESFGGGVIVLGELPRGLPPLADLPLFDLDLLGSLGPSIVAVGLIGLIEAASISRAVAARSGQYLNSDQEFVGQGLANIAAGIFSGYPVAGSLTRSAVNYEAGARSQFAAVMSSIWVLLAMLMFAPAAAFLPRAALAGILVVTGARMINHKEARRIMRTSAGDTAVMLISFAATLILSLEFAVLTGVLVSFARFVANTAMPSVTEMIPRDNFSHFSHQPEKPSCPQLGVLTIMGSLYFGAAPYVEDMIRAHMDDNPNQKFLMLRMRRVNHCDISGIHMLETVVNLYRQRGGEVFLVGVRKKVLSKMQLSGFDKILGESHFLETETAIPHIFYNSLNATECVYSCRVRVWKECQSLPKSEKRIDLPDAFLVPEHADVPLISPDAFWRGINQAKAAGQDLAWRVIDVREASEFERGHLRGAESIPLPKLLNGEGEKLRQDESIVFVCRSGRRSQQMAYLFKQKGYSHVQHLEGGMTALEIAALK